MTQHIQRGEHFGLHDGVAIGHNNDRTAQLDGASAGGQVAQQRQRFQKGLVGGAGERPGRGVGVLRGAAGGQHDVVAGKHRLEPQLLGALGKTSSNRASALLPSEIWTTTAILTFSRGLARRR